MEPVVRKERNSMSTSDKICWGLIGLAGAVAFSKLAKKKQSSEDQEIANLLADFGEDELESLEF